STFCGALHCSPNGWRSDRIRACRDAWWDRPPQPAGMSLSLPKRHNHTADYNKRSASQDGHGWQRPKKDKVGHLPHDEESGDVKTNHVAKFQWGKVQEGPIAQQQHTTENE